MQLSILSVLSAVATVYAAVIPRSDLDTFSLSAVHSAPEPLPQLGNVSWLGAGLQAVGGPLGWFGSSTHTALKLFIQYNAKEGIAFDSTKTSRTVYLRPAGANGLSEVVLGAPWVGRTPLYTLAKC